MSTAITSAWSSARTGPRSIRSQSSTTSRWLDGNYRAVRTASDDVANRRTDVVDLVSRYTGERAMRLWIDVDTPTSCWRKRPTTATGPWPGARASTTFATPDDIPEQVFTGSIPAGFTTVQGRSYQQPRALPSTAPDAGFSPITPKYLPDGFSLVGADVSTVNGVRNLHLIYSDGIRTLSLFENSTNRAVDFGGMQAHVIKFEGHDARYVHDGPTTLLAWRERRLAFALVGDLDLNELVAIAVSVVP